MEQMDPIWKRDGGESLSYMTLSEVGKRIRDAVYNEFGSGSHWITAEISDLSVRKGHCYLSLVEKMPGAAAPTSENRGIIWASRFEHVNKRFKEGTGADLSSGTIILFKASVKFDVKWGLSLVIDDIEPAFTLGLIQQERAKTIARLKQEGIFSNNKLLKFPMVPQKVALISAKDSRGYEDFMNKLLENPFAYRYDVKLFPSRLQGDVAAGEIVKQLINIYNSIEKYDVVAIVRGGGGSVDLNCFNDYRLSRAVARFPIPVISGIGHTANTSVVDEVAFTDRITPTDAADYLVEKTSEFESLLDESITSIYNLVQYQVNESYSELDDISKELYVHLRSFSKLANQELEYLINTIESKTESRKQALKNELQHVFMSIKSAVSHATISHHQKLSVNQKSLHTSSSSIIELQKNKFNQLIQLFALRSRSIINEVNNKLVQIEKQAELSDPYLILKKGYSITLVNNKVIKRSGQVKAGDIINTKVHEGNIKSKVEK